MDKEIIKATEKGKESLAPKKDFKGYTIEELRYQRALVALQKEFCKSKIIHKVDKIKHRKFFDNEKGVSRISKFGSLATKLLTGLNYLDYVMIGMSLFGSGRKVYKFFKRSK